MSGLRAPAEISWLADLVGAECALLVIELHGGTRLKIPAEPNQGSALALEIGLEPTQRLAAAFGGEQVKVPLLKWWRARVYRAQGMSYAAIARRLGCNEAQVWRYVGPSATGAQLALPLP